MTVRLIQQALLQVQQCLLDPTFIEHSYGFWPGRRVVVDLEKFFDRVGHDILIGRLRKRIDDAGVIWLVRAYLNPGIMDGGTIIQRKLGTPQGGPLSPLLANDLLDEVDKEFNAGDTGLYGMPMTVKYIHAVVGQDSA